MEQRLSLITLGVADLPRAKAFYGHLGWVGQEVQETVFFQAGGVVVVLWGREKLAADCGLPDPAGVADRSGVADRGGLAEDQQPAGFGGIALAHNVRLREEVDEILGIAQQAGARITRPAAETFYGGYAGVFTDPDGHPWEIAFNPGFTIGPDGSVLLPDFGAPSTG
jgi:catechol 2,3-dioxygenase-like lactoylglutathione lyase family enzyme